MLIRALVALIATGALAGCAQLLPHSRQEVVARWGSFAEARTTIEKIEPYKTTRADLKALGIDATGDPTVTLLSHADVALRFPIGGALKAEDIDPGICACIVAGTKCSGYLVNVKHMHRDRTGNFWIDSLRFKRVTDVTGWTFTATILFVGDTIVYAVYGGQPTIHEVEVEINPLGPLQGWGESVGGALY
jgi:hypothetical protein